MTHDRGEEEVGRELERALEVPALDARLSARALRRARAQLARPHEGALSVRGLWLALEDGGVPALVLGAAIVWLVMTLDRLIAIFAA